ncbi:MAG: hypothetical protein JNK74_23505 [Candidatus Hydrogenedentes bacterium]|nr:hypothetical protein [Candidatus Hydrogenedentota bacterium]
MKSLLIVLLATVAVMASSRSMVVAEPSGVLDIGDRKQLFLDQSVVESASGVTFTMNTPSKRLEGPVLLPDAPWEEAADGSIGLYCSVLRENGKTRLWYDVRFGDTVQVAYAESTDGIHFEKPALGIFPLNGSMENNIVMPSRIGGCAVWIDPNASPEQRYRSQSKGYNEPTAQQLYSYTSHDGIHWTQWMHENIGDCDTQSIAFWDRQVGRYVLYTRRNPNPGTPSRSRIIRRLESDDLTKWENETLVLQADAVDDATYASPTPKPPVDYYGGAVFRYPDEEGLYLMLSQPFWHFKRRPEGQRWGVKDVENPKSGENLGPATIDVRLNASRDGIHFERVGGRRPFLAPGLSGAFDSKMVWAIPNPIPMGDEIWIYYAGTNKDHDGFVDPAAQGLLSGISVTTLRLDGFVSADADYTGGELTTRPLIFSGNRLELNMDAGGGGSVQVELLDEVGAPISGFSRAEATLLCGNSVRTPVSWGEGSDVASLAGRPVRLRFIMRDCRLYAFGFTDTAG